MARARSIPRSSFSAPQTSAFVSRKGANADVPFASRRGSVIPTLLTVREVMRILGVRSPQVVYRARKHGSRGVRLPAVATPGGMRFAETDVVAYLRAVSDVAFGAARPRCALDRVAAAGTGLGAGGAGGAGGAVIDLASRAYPASRRGRRAAGAGGGR